LSIDEVVAALGAGRQRGVVVLDRRPHDGERRRQRATLAQMRQIGGGDRRCGGQ